MGNSITMLHSDLSNHFSTTRLICSYGDKYSVTLKLNIIPVVITALPCNSDFIALSVTFGGCSAEILDGPHRE